MNRLNTWALSECKENFNKPLQHPITRPLRHILNAEYTRIIVAIRCPQKVTNWTGESMAGPQYWNGYREEKE